jgi:EAL domain-containing protein (putative c-di-GMP-specific phosphodiesterase class I)
MYKAKSMGKNRYVFYDYNMGIELSERIETEKQLRSAFENDEFELYYQPNYDIKKGSVAGFEALIRWNSPIYGLIMPSQFIGIAEEMGLINKIGKWVIDKSFAFAKTLIEMDICVSCNVSSIQLIQSDFVDEVIEAFDRHGLKKGCAAIEITESCLVESFGEVEEKLKRLRDKGILVYLDDFGTGYSSLTYLKKLPIDVVKIDKSFVDDISNDGIEGRIVRTVVSLAHEIGLEVVAEGVETSEQLKYLTGCKCNYIQGYLISRPLPEHQAVELI